MMVMPSFVAFTNFHDVNTLTMTVQITEMKSAQLQNC